MGSLLMEGLAPWKQLLTLHSSKMACFLLCNCTFAACLNISGLYSIKLMGAPAAQIASKLNVPLVALLSCAFMGESLTLTQAACALVLISSVWMFEHAQEHEVSDWNSLLGKLPPSLHHAKVES